MLRFFTFLWIAWIFRMLLVTLVLASVAAFFLSLLLYMMQGSPAFSPKIYKALFEIFGFWFLIFLNVAIPLALFINAKYLFNLCLGGFCLHLLSCPKDGDVETIEEIGYGDLIAVWRKWLLLIVWNTAVLVLAGVAFSYFFTSHESVFDWFNVYLLYVFILVAGFFSLVLLASRCKRVKISKC